MTGEGEATVSDHVIDHITLYLDDELQEEERVAFEAHVHQCPECWARLEEERELVMAIRQAAAPPCAPQYLRARIEAMLGRSSLRDGVRNIRLWLPLAAAAMVIMSVMAWLAMRSGPRSTAQPSAFARLAVDTHQRYTRGQLPLEITSRSPQEISNWFAGKLPFNLKLPDYPEGPGQSKPYEVVGARLIGFQQDYAAYVAYRLRQRPISLLVTSETVAQPTGGEEIAWRGLRFHFDAIDGWKVLTWSDNGLTYALVSDFEERGQASCIVCHPGAQDRPMLEGLNRR